MYSLMLRHWFPRLEFPHDQDFQPIVFPDRPFTHHGGRSVSIRLGAVGAADAASSVGAASSIDAVGAVLSVLAVVIGLAFGFLTGGLLYRQSRRWCPSCGASTEDLRERARRR